MIRICLVLTVSIMLMVSCGPSKYVAPLEKNQLAVSGQLGGPLFQNLGYTLPIPLTAVGVGYGMSEKLTTFADLQLTEASFGVIHLNLGATYYLTNPSGWTPGLSSSLILNNAVSTWDGRAKLWPQLDVTARWRYGKKHNLWYGGLNNFFELSGKKAFEQPQQKNWIPAIFAGHVFTGEKWDFNIEGKYIAPFEVNNDVVVDYIGIGNHGGLGIYFGIVKKF